MWPPACDVDMFLGTEEGINFGSLEYSGFRVWGLPIGPKVVPFWDHLIEF